MKRRLATAGAVLVAALASAAGAAPKAETVMLEVRRFYSESCNCFKLEFSGVISSGAPNEYVAVMQQKCRQAFATAVAGASTVAGGSWIAEYTGGGLTPATYRARWQGNASEPWTLRPPIGITPARELGGRRFQVIVYGDPTMVDLTRRLVELQRLAAGKWARVRRTRLVFPKQFAGAYTATFTVRTRGLRLRVLVPAATAAPCYTAAVTKTFRS